MKTYLLLAGRFTGWLFMTAVVYIPATVISYGCVRMPTRIDVFVWFVLSAYLCAWKTLRRREMKLTKRQHEENAA